MKKISQLILIAFSIVALVLFIGCSAPDDSAEPVDETSTEETIAPEDAAAPTDEAAPAPEKTKAE